MKGEKDNDLQNHMKYNLYKEEDKTWENAYLVACRWEAAHDQPSSSESETDDEDDVKVADPASTVATVTSVAPVASVPSFAYGAAIPYVVTASVGPAAPVASVATMAPSALVTGATSVTIEQSLAALTIAVKKNAEDIQQLKYQQEQLQAQQKQLETETKAWQQNADFKIDRILWAVEGPPQESE